MPGSTKRPGLEPGRQPTSDPALRPTLQRTPKHNMVRGTAVTSTPLLLTQYVYLFGSVRGGDASRVSEDSGESAT